MILDPALIPDPAAWLAEHVAHPRGKELAWVRVEQPAPLPPEPPRPEPTPPQPDGPAWGADLPDEASLPKPIPVWDAHVVGPIADRLFRSVADAGGQAGITCKQIAYWRRRLKDKAQYQDELPTSEGKDWVSEPLDDQGDYPDASEETLVLVLPKATISPITRPLQMSDRSATRHTPSF